MLLSIKRKFLFRCEECEMILSIELDDQEEIEKVDQDKVALECPCGSHCHVLRD